MHSHGSRIRRLALASALVLASSCNGKPTPPASLNPPADLFAAEPAPQITTEALTSERAFERWRDDRDDWGKRGWAALHTACRWFADAGVPVTCPSSAP